MGHHIYSREERIKKGRQMRKIMNAKHHLRDKIAREREKEILNKNLSCASGLNLNKPFQVKKEKVQKPQRVVMNRTPEEWKSILQQAKI